MSLFRKYQSNDNRRFPTFYLPGKIVLINIVLLSLSGLLASLSTWTLFISIVLDFVAFVLGIVGIFTVSYLVFMTQGRGHYQLTLWKIADAFLANIIAQAAINFAAWKFGFVTTIATPMFTHTTSSVSAWYALYDLFLYSSLLFTGGGTIDNQAINEFPRIICALQSTWSSFSYIIIFAGADAALISHTDEKLTNETKNIIKK